MGLKISDVVNMPLSKIMSLSRDDLAYYTRALVRESNKRLTNLKKRGIATPATSYIKKHGGKFSLKTRRGRNKNVAELREEFQRAKGFLESETSTIKGFRKWENKVAETLKNNAGIDYNSLTESQKHRFWQVYSKLEETDHANVYGGNYRTSVREIYDAVKSGLRKKDIDAFVIELNQNIYQSTKKDFTGAFKLFD